ncbi:hypothetical protein O4445_04555 [Xylella fastidiosa subsp. pauca]|uniref:Uncharacterized protein n=1 Tax=Xylella fastidiosa (strain 9a5c) TaxID=160492 RepID=Q9PD05_XYLFA|nr:hypothetical protein [Xylella fastidiosa]AAF84408.1 hypothetical protein XF_1599 [Xylella fastidiosa 9a5c]WGZ35158.1 hypothetical protein O4445_04555 [Xylella fastidiosa subsp. pauca]
MHDIAVTADGDHAHAATAESAGRHGHTVSIDRFGEHHNLPAPARHGVFSRFDYCLSKNIDYEDVASWLVGGGQLYF